ncbi:type III polyketide synthase [Ferdinandcohnia quinoae]|uniref:Type III polyketide synthase n=1 Tax=Fredinandcohnia quinoae TaxID=2918902 RepID=A0AAW5E776_9BACI|nr:3-oxoacyl-[acyl-carrier-protein] synthase III C-terminal domain-containing protein [Fredinandcohnia sp. SECRCQ15]MCH1627344.1 type III polyketide synthase [Fredinandcohnia sp. SECRCQ15]
MPKVLSIGICNPPTIIDKDSSTKFVRDLFKEQIPDIHRMLKIFENGGIRKRHISENLSWYGEEHSFEEKNNTYIEKSIKFGVKAINNCLNSNFLKVPVPIDEISAFIFISSTGIATPSIEARIMNQLDFSPHTKRIPIWGLGCAGGAAGLARAFEYCKAYPTAKVIVLAIELCSLTFQKSDLSKSNLIGTSLFADGVACACVIGDDVDWKEFSNNSVLPSIIDSQSTLMKNSEDVMGWSVKNNGLHVIFSKDIPTIVRTWLRGNVELLLEKHSMSLNNIQHFVAHPGGKKVLDAYETSLSFPPTMTKVSRQVLSEYGNMSSATIIYVLKEFMEADIGENGEIGLLAALGPGFSSEILLIQWGN